MTAGEAFEPALASASRSSARRDVRRGLSRISPILCVTLLLATGGAQAGGRPRYGGTLKVGAVAASLAHADPLLADSPVEAALLSLDTTAPCRLGELTRVNPTLVHLALAPNVTPQSVVAAAEAVGTSASPYAALLAGVKRVAVVGPSAVEFTLVAPGIDVEHALCHPSLAVPIGPFKAGAKQLVPNSQHPSGRPYVDSVVLSVQSARAAERLIAQRSLHVVLGATTSDDSPQLFATYLLTNATRPDIRQAVGAVVDRTDLTRFFVRAPASPMPALLPPSLGGGLTPAPAPPKPTPTKPDITLLYDTSHEDQRPVAERLQVKLGSLGYRVALEGLGRAALRERWRAKTYDLMLQAVLLPAAPGPALAVVAALGGHPEAMDSVNSVADPSARDKAARDAALSLELTLPLVPLYVQGLGVSSTKDVQHLTRDSLGLVRLDDAFLATE